MPVQIVQAKVSTVTTLVNDGSAVGTQIIESTPLGDASSAVSVLNTGVVVLGNATHGGSLSVGNANFKVDTGGNITNVASITNQGNESVSGTLTVTGDATFNGADPAITIPNNVSISSKDVGGTVRKLIYEDASNNLQIGTGAGNAIGFNNSAGTQLLNLDNNSQLNWPTNTNGLQAVPTAVNEFQFRVGGSLQLRVVSNSIVVNRIGFATGSISNAAIFSGTGNGTVATGVTNPAWMASDPCTVSGSSQTIGMTMATSSVVTTGSGLAWKCLASN